MFVFYSGPLEFGRRIRGSNVVVFYLWKILGLWGSGIENKRGDVMMMVMIMVSGEKVANLIKMESLERNNSGK